MEPNYSGNFNSLVISFFMSNCYNKDGKIRHGGGVMMRKTVKISVSSVLLLCVLMMQLSFGITTGEFLKARGYIDDEVLARAGRVAVGYITRFCGGSEA